MKPEFYIYLSMLIFAVIEYWKPRKMYGFFTRHKMEDGVWYVLNEIVYNALIGVFTYKAGQWFELQFTTLNLSIDLKNLEIWIQFAIFFLVMDFISFLYHYLSHRGGFLWETHKIHHSITELSFISAFRHSWTSNIIQHSFFAFMSGWMHVDETVRLWANIVFALICMFQHVNVHIQLPKILEYFFITPKNHFWHHSLHRHKSFGQNFGLIFAGWDHMFGTYYNPNHYNSEIGLDQNPNYTSFLNKMLHPMDTILINQFKKIFNKS